MTSTRITIGSDLVYWLRSAYHGKFINEFGFVPTDSQLVSIGLTHLKSYQTGKEFDVQIDKKKKCIKIKEC